MKVSVCLLAIPLLIAADPSGEQLLRLSLERSGGAAAFAKLTSVVMTGTVEMAGHNIGGPVSVYQQGGKSYTAIDLPGIGKVEEGFDGSVAWESNTLQGPRIKEGEERAAVARASRISLLDSWRDLYTSAKTVGSEDVDGKPAWKVEMTPKEGKAETFFFDKASGLLVRSNETVATPLGEIAVEAGLSDYRTVDGIETPFTMTQKAVSQVMVMHFDKVSYNAPIPPGRFDLPPSIKALAERKK
jgi:zinc protease